jgi:hypothetical protein
MISLYLRVHTYVRMNCREQEKLVAQNHALTQQKMLHCKTVVNIITYHRLVHMTLIVIFFSFF